MKKLTLLFAMIALLGSACSKDDDEDSTPPANEVYMQGNAFKPSSITVAAGTTIKWTNKDGTTHTVTSNAGGFGSGNLGDGSTFSFTFDSAGTYAYHCAIHSSMTGSVIVH